LGAVVVDVRFTPLSRWQPQWNRNALEKLLGNSYFYCHNLGNANYKGQYGEGVRLWNKDGGLVEVDLILQDHPVIIMCTCADRGSCHRKVVVEAIEAYGLPANIPITLDLAKTIAGETPPAPKPVQPALF